MFRLFLAFSWRSARRRPARTLLSLTAVALGVALYLAAAVANESLTASFEEAGQTLTRHVDWHVATSLGMDPKWVGPVEDVPGVAAVAPVIQSPATLVTKTEDGERRDSVVVLGIDPKRDPSVRDYANAAVITDATALALGGDAVVVPREFLDAHGLSAGDTITLHVARLRTFRIAGVIELEGATKAVADRLVFMALPVAQRAFARSTVDRLDIVCADDADVDAVRARVAAVLPPGAMFWTPADDAVDYQRSVATFQSVLVVIALLSVLVAVAFIYNTLTLAVVERAREIGVLRSLGASAATVRRLFMLEAAAYGVVGTALGIVLGLAIARTMLDFLSKSIEVLYFSWHPDALSLTPGQFVFASVLGVGACVVASWSPARKASQTSPLAVMNETAYRRSYRERYRKSFALGLLLIASSFVFWFEPHLWPEQGGNLMTLMLAVGISLVMPHVTLVLLRGVHRIIRPFAPITARLAIDHLLKYPTRTAMTVVMAGMSLALILGISVITTSLKLTLEEWLYRVIPGDIIISTSEQLTNANTFQPAEQSLRDTVAALEGVETTFPLRFVTIKLGDRRVMLSAIDLEQYGNDGIDRMGLLRGDRDTLLATLTAGKGALVSENYELHTGVGIGDTVTLPTPSGEHRYPVVGVVEDYSWPEGVITLDWHEYVRVFDDDRTDMVEVMVAPGHDEEAVVQRIQKALAPSYRVVVTTKAEYIRRVIGFIDQMHTMTYFQGGVALIVGIFAIFVAVTLTVVLRRREIGLLRAIGMTRRQVAAMVGWEALALGVASGIFGVIAGMLAYLPARVIMFAQSGYVFAFHLPYVPAAATFLLAIVIGALACIAPVRNANRMSITQAVGYE